MAEIVATDGILGGKPRIDGSRVGVFDVYELVVEGGHSPADIADQLDLTIGEVYTALAYYHEHAEEMREVRKRRDDAETTLAETAVGPPERVS